MSVLVYYTIPTRPGRRSSPPGGKIRARHCLPNTPATALVVQPSVSPLTRRFRRAAARRQNDNDRFPPLSRTPRPAAAGVWYLRRNETISSGPVARGSAGVVSGGSIIIGVHVARLATKKYIDLLRTKYIHVYNTYTYIHTRTRSSPFACVPGPRCSRSSDLRGRRMI